MTQRGERRLGLVQMSCGFLYPTAISSEPEHPELSTADAWETMIRSHYGNSFVADPLGRILAKAGSDRRPETYGRLLLR